ELPGHHFLTLDIGSPVERLRAPIRSLLAGRAENQHLTQAAINRRGRPIDVAVTMTRLTGDGAARGIILLMDAAARDRGGAPAGLARADGSPDGESAVD